jgi:hypothetical protein
LGASRPRSLFETGTLRPVIIEIRKSTYGGEVSFVSRVLRDGYADGYIFSQEPGFEMFRDSTK